MTRKSTDDTVEFEAISRRHMLAATGTIGAAGIAGCSGNGNGGGNGNGNGGNGNGGNGNGGTGTTNQVDNQDISIRYIPHGAPGQDPFWSAQSEGWQMAVDQLGVDAAYQGPDSSANFTQQVSNVETAIDSGADAIAVTLPDPDLFQDALQRAAEEGVYVIVTNVTEQSFLESGEQSMPYHGYVGQNEAMVGSTLASNTLPLIEEELGSQPSRAVILNHDPGHSALSMRQDGIEQVLEEQGISNDWIEVPGGDPSGVISRLASFRSSNPDTSLVFTLGPTAGNPAIDYISNEGLEGEMFHAGCDISQSQADAINEGYNLAAVIQQPALQAYQAAHYLTTQVNSGILTPTHTPTGPTFVDASNVDAVQQQIEKFGVA
ncbi:substrate-binding domain-containing protein [Halopenitus sp. POP-27]|uniref:substrate-binding domain-containing protein n=1 Tax=Halopenitus sp. POP-27 TaxID=2994425 RepID=UPI002468CE17|nr:substrate-binding domain-containing protein [Halopenitus sp. POP-27]